MVGSRIHKLKMDAEQVEKFQNFFMEKSGLVFEGRRIKEMEQAVSERMIEVGMTSFDEYLDHLARQVNGTDELNHLVVSLTVGETQFYRTPEQFAALRKYILPELIEREKAGGRKLRILSAGCATGEEPYTLAILLHELLPDLDSWDIRISACDINRKFLESAKKGVYGKRKIRLVDPVTLGKYFDRKGKTNWLVKDFLKDNIEWSHFNINSESFESLCHEERFDIVLCRNVLIYFKLDNLRKVVNKFHKIIRPEGYFMLGYSETLFKISDRFQSVHTPEAFFYQKTDNPTPSLAKLPDKPVPYQRDELLKALGSRPHPLAKTKPKIPKKKVRRVAAKKSAGTAPPPGLALPKPPPGKVSAAKIAMDEGHLWEAALELFSNERFNEARQKFDEMIEQNPCSARAHLGLGFLYANLGAEDRSREHAEEAKRHDDLLPEIYFLLALLDEKNSQFEAAIANYQRIILLSPDFAMAHFNLGNLFYKLHRHRDARREFGNTITILADDADNKSLRFSGGLSRDAVISFCEIQRDQIAKALPGKRRAGRL